MTRICPRCSSEIDVERNLCPVCFFGEGLKADTVECTKCHSELDDDAPAGVFRPVCLAAQPATLNVKAKVDLRLMGAAEIEVEAGA